MNMRRMVWVGLILATAASACRKKQVIPVDTSQAQDIPREIALGKLREILPTAETIACTLPKDSWKPSEIRQWAIEPGFVELRFAKGDPLRLTYVEITKTATQQYGRNYLVRIYTEAQKDPEREHFTFGWKNLETAKQVLELFDALRTRQ